MSSFLYKKSGMEFSSIPESVYPFFHYHTKKLGQPKKSLNPIMTAFNKLNFINVWSFTINISVALQTLRNN